MAGGLSVTFHPARPVCTVREQHLGKTHLVTVPRVDEQTLSGSLAGVGSGRSTCRRRSRNVSQVSPCAAMCGLGLAGRRHPFGGMVCSLWS